MILGWRSEACLETPDADTTKREGPMNAGKNPCLWLTVLTVVGILSLIARPLTGAVALTTSERENARGGSSDNKQCVGTTYSCPDPMYKNSCTLSGSGQICQECAASNVPYSTCLPGCMTCNCLVSTPPNAPWCGTYYYGTPTNGQCPESACNTKSGNCGVQIGTASGDKCGGS